MKRMILQLDDLEKGGIIRDTAPHELPPNVFSNGNNVRVHNNSLERSLGYAEVFTAPSVAPYYLYPWQDTSSYYWFYANASEIYRTDGTTNVNVTRTRAAANITSSASGGGNLVTLSFASTSYVDGAFCTVAGNTAGSPAINGTYNITRISDTQGTIDAGSPWVSSHTDGTITIAQEHSAGSYPLWQGFVFGGVPIMNHTGLSAGEYPQSWNGTANFQNLTNWPVSSPIWICKVMRPFKNVLVALYMQEDGVQYPTRLRWSGPADPGTVPTDWEPASTNLAGTVSFSDSTAPLVDCLPLRDLNVVYKEDSVHLMQLVGGIYVFNFRRAFSEFGLLTPRCVKSFFGKHFVVSFGDIVLHNGQEAQSIVTKKMRMEIFNSISSDNYENAYVIAYPEKEEMWVCIPINGSGVTSPTVAYVWNWRENVWTRKDLPGMAHIALGVITETGSMTFNQLADGASSGSFDSRTGSFDQRNYNPSILRLLGADTVNTKFIRFDTTNEHDGTGFTSYVERTGLAINGLKGGTITVDPNSLKFVRRIYPKMTADAGATVTIKIGGQMFPGDAVTWTGSYQFRPGVDTYISTRAQWKLLAYRVESSSAHHWELQSIGFDMDIVGTQ